MKKLLLLFTTAFFIGNISSLKAQCYGAVQFDAAASGNGSNTFNITTSHCNELIMISYDGWQGPGTGPVKVDGNNATYINTAFVYFYAVAETYAYFAPLAGVHTIVCTEPPYSSPYYLNSAAAFYATGTSNNLSIASLTNSQSTVSCVGGGTVTATINTTIPATMIYSNFDCNNGQVGPFVDSWTGATFINQLHEGNGLDQSEAYTNTLPPGTYTVSANCSSSPFPCGGLALLLVAIPPPACGGGGGSMAVVPTITQPTCGNCNGAISFAVSGGSGPYTYSWTPNITTNSSASGLCPGTYSINIQDASCPPKDSLLVITLIGNALTVAANATAKISCNGDCNASAIATITGGSAPFTYVWRPSGGSIATATDLCAGIYTVTVTDSRGCTGTASVDITQPAVLTVPTSAANIACFGGTGSITANPVGGTNPYTYLWSTVPPQTNKTATGLSVGSYTVTVTDINGCTATASASVTQPTQLIATMGIITNPACGGGTGSANVIAAGGTPNYTYLWAPTGGINATGTGLTAGNYTVTVKDANGCTTTASATITQPIPVRATMGAPTAPLCNGGTGSAFAVGGGGTGPYSYFWTPSGQTNATATGLVAGSYTVTVKDIYGCTATGSVSITQPTAIVITTSFVHASCSLPNGNATANATGGTAPYLYTWNPSGQTNATATGLAAGSYTVTVTDNNHCNSTASVTVTQPSAVAASISGTTEVTCNGGTNGTATAIATGGTGPYTYVWAPGGNTNAVGTGLSAGTYTMTVTDANGCRSTAVATVNQPAAMTASASGPTTLCVGATGTFTATVAGGTSPYTYQWSTGPTTSIASITPTLTSFSFTVTVTDANGCSASAETSVIFGAPLLVFVAGQNSICNGKSTRLCANVSGGTGGNTYLWTPGNITTPCINVSPVSTQTYNVSVSDNCGISAGASSTVNVNPYPDIGLFADIYQGCAPLCIQFHNTTSSADGIAQYTWSFGNGDTAEAESPIYCYTGSGTYNITLVAVSDSGCSATLEQADLITVFARPIAAFTLSPQPTDVLNATIQFTDKSMDKAGIIYHIWSFGDGTDSISNLENPSHTYQDTGNYCATMIVTDANNCVDTATNCLVIGPSYNLYIPSAFTPNRDGRNDVFMPKGSYVKNYEMYIFDRWGMKLFHSTDITNGWNGTINGGSTIAQEDTYIYIINVTDSQGNKHSYTGRVNLIK